MPRILFYSRVNPEDHKQKIADAKAGLIVRSEWFEKRMKEILAMEDGRKTSKKMGQKPVVHLDENGNQIGYYDSITDVVAKTGLTKYTLAQYLKGTWKPETGQWMLYAEYIRKSSSDDES